jgi:hypothetical protein
MMLPSGAAQQAATQLQEDEMLLNLHGLKTVVAKVQGQHKD